MALRIHFFTSRVTITRFCQNNDYVYLKSPEGMLEISFTLTGLFKLHDDYH